MQHDGKLPEYEQKDEFKASLKAWRMKSDEENFDEADNKAYYVTQKTEASSSVDALIDADHQIPGNIQELLQQTSVKNISSGVSRHSSSNCRICS